MKGAKLLLWRLVRDSIGLVLDLLLMLRKDGHPLMRKQLPRPWLAGVTQLRVLLRLKAGQLGIKVFHLKNNLLNTV